MTDWTDIPGNSPESGSPFGPVDVGVLLMWSARYALPSAMIVSLILVEALMPNANPRWRSGGRVWPYCRLFAGLCSRNRDCVSEVCCICEQLG